VLHKARAEINRKLKDVFRAQGLKPAQHRASCMIEDYQIRFSPLAKWFDGRIHETVAVFDLPRKHQERLKTTNGLECYHEELSGEPTWCASFQTVPAEKIDFSLGHGIV